MLYVIMLSAFILIFTVIMLSVAVVSVIILRTIMLSVTESCYTILNKIFAVSLC